MVGVAVVILPALLVIVVALSVCPGSWSGSLVVGLVQPMGCRLGFVGVVVLILVVVSVTSLLSGSSMMVA